MKDLIIKNDKFTYLGTVLMVTCFCILAIIAFFVLILILKILTFFFGSWADTIASVIATILIISLFIYGMSQDES